MDQQEKRALEQQAGRGMGSVPLPGPPLSHPEPEGTPDVIATSLGLSSGLSSWELEQGKVRMQILTAAKVWSLHASGAAKLSSFITS